jgi:hypothetical protein
METRRGRGDREIANRLGIGQRVWGKRDGIKRARNREKRLSKSVFRRG